MSHRIGLNPTLALNILRQHGVNCELSSNGEEYRITGHLHDIVYSVDFYEPMSRRPDTFLSLRLQAAKSLGTTLAPTALLDICNDLNCRYRHCTFAIAGKTEKSLTVASDFEVLQDPESEFCSKWQWFEKLIVLFANEAIQSRTITGDGADDLHNRAVLARWASKPDFKKALSLYRQAAELGFAGSQNNLGDAYECGEGITKSDVVAAYWYARAAERGEPTAYMSLATLLSRTAPDSESLAEAAMYALLALRHLPNGTNQMLTFNCYAQIKSRLPDELLVHAKERARAWRPLFQEGRLLSDTPEQIQPAGIEGGTH